MKAKAILLVADAPGSTIWPEDTLREMVAKDKTGKLSWDDDRKCILCIMEFVEPIKTADTKMEYQVFREDFLPELVRAVNDRIAEGWKPHGTPFELGDSGFVYQAMTREKP